MNTKEYRILDLLYRGYESDGQVWCKPRQINKSTYDIQSWVNIKHKGGYRKIMSITAWKILHKLVDKGWLTVYRYGSGDYFSCTTNLKTILYIERLLQEYESKTISTKKIT